MSTHPRPLLMAEFCYVHYERESGPGWRRCFECGHLYRTEQELVEDNYRNDTEFDFDAKKLSADEIFACAHCGHDF
jgi:hypothetical protein